MKGLHVSGSRFLARPGIVLAAVIATLLVAPAVADARAQKPAPGNVIEGRYIVVYENAVASADAETDRHEREKGFKAKFRYRRAVKGFAATLTDGQVRKFEADPDVAFVVSDRTVKAYGVVPLASGETAPPAGVRRIQAASATTTRQASDVAVAVLDTGIDLSHPDLNAASGVNCVTPGAPAQDDEGHGTHVAGTIAAKNNGAGVVGVAPGTKLYAVKVLDSAGNGTWSQIICGLDWVTANAAALKIKVANMSLGGPGSNDRNCGLTDGDPLHQAICRSTNAGVTYVVAAGNNGWDIGDSPPDTPAAFPEALTVSAFADTDGKGGATGPAPSCAATEGDDRHASFSNYATRAADAAHMVAAPGVCIVSTVPGGYAVSSGTSMASPHVAGAVALCLAEGGVAGPCAGKSAAQIIAHVRGEAETYARADASSGFAGDPLRPNQWGDYFGFLARAPQDTTAPDTALSDGPTGVLASTTGRFTFGATEPGSTFQCKLDGGAWETCASPRSVGALADGPHTFSVRATDLAANVDASPAARSWSVDTTGPETTIVSGPEGVTKNPTPTFEFSASEQAAFQCRVDSQPWAACASPHRTATLANGAHTFAVRALDALGNADATPATRAFTVDPATVATMPPKASSDAATGVQETSATLTATVNANGEATSYRFEYGTTAAYGSATAEASAGDGTTDQIVSAIISGLAPGTTYHFRVVATNAAGTTTGEDVTFTTASPPAPPPPAPTPTPEPPPAPSPAPAPAPSPSPAPAPAPTPAPPAVAPAPADTTAPAVSLAIPRQRLGVVLRRGLRVSLRSSERANTTLRLWLDGRTAKRLGLARTAKAVVVGRASTSFAAAGGKTVYVKLGRTARARIARLASVTLTVRASARDFAGNVGQASRRATLKR